MTEARTDGATPPRRGGDQRIPRPPVVRRGAGPWWHQPGAALPAVISVADVRAALAAAGSPVAGGRSPQGPPAPGQASPGGGPAVQPVELPSRDPRPAAVLCALWDGPDGQARVVLTRRSRHLRSHTGEVAFPGGRLDPGEDAESAALREAREEVGLDPAAVEVVATLTPLATLASRSAITPFVGVLPEPPRLVPNPAEVDRAWSVPLVELVGPGVYHEERWDALGQHDRPVHFFDLEGDTIWGATARLLRELLDLVLGGERPAGAGGTVAW